MCEYGVQFVNISIKEKLLFISFAFNVTCVQNVDVLLRVGKSISKWTTLILKDTM